MMDTKQPEALRIADDLHHSITHYGGEDAFTFAAYEAERCVRALHAENEILHAENESLRASFDTLRTGYDAARLEIASLNAQLAAVGAGGVEPLRKRECLHQISEPAQPKFSTRDDAERLKSVARGMSYNDIGEAVWKYTLLEIAMRLETGGYVAPQPAAQALDAQQYANRYRHIRCFGLPMDAFGDCDSYYGVYTSQTGECLDAAIDAAISALQGSA